MPLPNKPTVGSHTHTDTPTRTDLLHAHTYGSAPPHTQTNMLTYMDESTCTLTNPHIDTYAHRYTLEVDFTYTLLPCGCRVFVPVGVRVSSVAWNIAMQQTFARHLCAGMFGYHVFTTDPSTHCSRVLLYCVDVDVMCNTRCVFHAQCQKENVYVVVCALR